MDTYKPGGVRERMALEATKKAYKAFRRHGEEDIRFQKALRSRWIKGGMA